MNKAFLNKLYKSHLECPQCPSPDAVSLFFTELLGTLFPYYSKKPFSSTDELELHIKELKLQLGQILYKNPDKSEINSEAIADLFFDKLPVLHTRLSEDVTAMFEGDPAAKS